MDCYPDPKCRCCVCVGIHCFRFHPGHNHHYKTDHDMEYLKKLEVAVQEALNKDA
jgi:hypothetical protein